MYYKYSKIKRGRGRRRFFLLCLAGVSIILLLLIIKFYKNNTFIYSDTRFDSIIDDVSKRYALDPMLVKAVIWRESDFKPNAVGLKGEIGLMQLMVNSSVKDWTNYTKREITGKGVLFNPKLNIEIGAWYLAKSRNRWLNYNNCNALALAGYNAGYSNVKKWIPKNYQGNDVIELIKFPSTKEYVKSILEKYESYKTK